MKITLLEIITLLGCLIAVSTGLVGRIYNSTILSNIAIIILISTFIVICLIAASGKLYYIETNKTKHDALVSNPEVRNSKLK